MSDQQIEDTIAMIEGLVYGRLVDDGVSQRDANRISTRAATRMKDMLKDAVV